MPRFKITIKEFGNQAILIEWPNRIDEDILDDIIQYTATILENEKGEVINHTPGYNSLLLQYTSPIDFKNKKRLVLEIYKSQQKENSQLPKCWHIPVCYNEKFGVDLNVFAEKGLSPDEVVHLHTTKPYRVYMIGFLPGFLYLGGLQPGLHMNRKQKPRLQIPRGAVAIGGEQTGIYPMSSPGGWQIIGRTPLSLFDISKERPTPIKQGDNIQFYAINMDTYQNLCSHMEKTLPTRT